MPRIVINPDTSAAWEQVFPAGEYTAGRSPENALVLDHPSVSSSHCSLVVSEDQLQLCDLGSTAGTFVSGQLVETAVVPSGTDFRLGEVALRFESDAASRAPAADASPGATEGVPTAHVTAGLHCKYHPHALARHYCPQCRIAFCELCVETRSHGGGMGKRCRKCGSECQHIKVRPVLLEERPEFWTLLPGALSYPLRGSGIFLLVAGGVFSVLLGWLPLLGFLITGYMFNYAKQIFATSAAGQPEPPDWPDFTDWTDTILVPYFHLLALGALTFGPTVILATWLPSTETNYWIFLIATIAFGVLLN